MPTNQFNGKRRYMNHGRTEQNGADGASSFNILVNHVEVACVLAVLHQVDDVGVSHPSQEERAFQEACRLSQLRKWQLAHNYLLPPRSALALRTDRSNHNIDAPYMSGMRSRHVGETKSKPASLETWVGSTAEWGTPPRICSPPVHPRPLLCTHK